MAEMQIFIMIKGEPEEAVPLVQESLAYLQERFSQAGHQVSGKIRFNCVRCGQLMTLRDKTLVCDGCFADEERERQATHLKEQDFYPGLPLPAEPLEALID